MHGLLVGAVFGMAFIAFMGAWRSVQNWRASEKRPSAILVGVQVFGQIGLGVTATVFGIWFLLFGG